MGRHDVRAIQGQLFLAQPLELGCAAGIGSQERAVPGLPVHHDQRCLAPGQPLPEQVVRARCVLLDVVHDQVPVSAQQIPPARRLDQQVLEKDLDLQAKIEQVVRQAVIAKRVRASLCLIIHPLARALAAPRPLEPLSDLGVCKADHRRLVQVVDDLADQPAAADRQAVKIPGLDVWRDHAVHIVLRRL